MFFQFGREKPNPHFLGWRPIPSKLRCSPSANVKMGGGKGLKIRENCMHLRTLKSEKYSKKTKKKHKALCSEITTKAKIKGTFFT